MKCPNCGKTEFENMPLFDCDICASEGFVWQLVDAWVCVNCGRVELYMPKKLIDERLEKNRIERERQKVEETRKQQEACLRARMQELTEILKDENRTLKELKEAQSELKEIQNKLHIGSWS